MTETEIITGNDEICQALGFKSDKVYVYRVPNTFPFERETDTGWTEFNTQQIGFHQDWNLLIGAYNRMLENLANMTETQRRLLAEEKNFVVSFGVKNFFGIFENQLHIASSWIKLVDFCKWYNSVKLIGK
jgi:hypothetical protein